MTQTIAVVSLNNGVGKTTLALNLGMALKKLNHKVLVFDADFTKKNMIEHLDIHQLPTDLKQVFAGDAHIRDAIYTHVSGLNTLPSTIHSYNGLSAHYPELMSHYDYIIMDTPTDPRYLELALQNADDAIIVHSPEHSTKTIVDAANMLARMKRNTLGVVFNKFGANDIHSIHGYPILEKIPNSKEIIKSFQLKHPVLYTHPISPVSIKFNRLANRFG